MAAAVRGAGTAAVFTQRPVRGAVSRLCAIASAMAEAGERRVRLLAEQDDKREAGANAH